MKSRMLVVVLVFAIGSAPSCSHKGLTLPQYFDRFAAITSVMDQKTQDLQTRSDASMVAAKVDADRLKVLHDSLAEQVAIVGDAVREWDALTPPTEVKAAHDAYVAAVDGYVKSVTAGLQGFARFKTMQEAQNAILTPELQQAGATINADCAKLQGIATAQKIQVDLGCTSGGSSSANAGG